LERASGLIQDALQDRVAGSAGKPEFDLPVLDLDRAERKADAPPDYSLLSESTGLARAAFRE